MAEIRDRGSVLATEEGVQTLQNAKATKRNHAGKRWTYCDIGIESGIEERTIGRFFRREQPIDESSARAICQALEVDYHQIVETPSVKKPSEKHEPESEWRGICRGLLNHWKGLTTNALTTANGVRFQLDDIFVPLGVVERIQKPSHSPTSGSPEQGSALYAEKVTPISQDAFFDQVLQQRQSKYSQGSRIAIIGEPGAGKTTQLQRIGDWILDETDGVPIWIPLGAIGTRSIKEYLLNDWLQSATQELEITPQNREELSQLLKTKKVWLLLDGVDEMAVSDALQKIASQMREGWLQNVRVILTCRLNVWNAGKNALDGFDVYRNLDFEYPTEVHLVVRKWFADNLGLQSNLIDALEQPGKERIRDMVKNPLRLILLCYSWQLHQGDLPDTKAGLYEWFVDTFYEWNKGKVPTKLSVTKRGELNHALGELAKAAIDQDSSRFRLRENFINRFLGATDDESSLFHLALRMSWLNYIGVAEENPLEKVYAFFHPTFQEYFAALAVNHWDYFLPHEHNNENPKPVEGKEYRAFKFQWEEVILLWLGRSHEEISASLKEEFLKSLFHFNDGCGGFYTYKAYLLVAEGTIEYKNFSRYTELLTRIVRWSIGCINIEGREQWIHSFLASISTPAILTLQKMPIHEVRTSLLELVSDKEEKIQEEAISVLNEIENGTFFKNKSILFGKNKNLEHIPVRRIIDDLNLDDLIESLHNTRDEPGKYYWIIDTILELDVSNQVAIDALNYLLEKCQDDWVLLLAANKTLDYFPKNDRAIQSLVTLLYSSHNDVPWRAAESLGEFGSENWTAIKGLVSFLSVDMPKSADWQKTLIDEWTIVNVVCSLAKIIQHNSFAFVVNQLRFNINQRVFQGNFECYRWCHNLLWDISQDMNYLSFYQAWNESLLITD